MNKIFDILAQYKDDKFAEFQRKLLPNLPKKSIIGVKTPTLKDIAKKLDAKSSLEFISRLPHEFFEENQLHAFLISKEKNFSTCINLLEMFLPFINNWATCDQTSPVCFSKNKDLLLPYLQKWIKSESSYVKRFAIVSYMRHFLDESYDKKYLDLFIYTSSCDYYVQMAVAWLLQVALVKRWDDALSYFTEYKLPKFIHNKAIQKAVESYRISKEQKIYLKTLKI